MGNPITTLHDASVNILFKFSPDGARLVSSCMGGLRLWNGEIGCTVATLEPASWLTGSAGTYTTFEFSPEGSRNVSRSVTGLRLWDGKAGDHIVTLARS